jgi:hypothetical protein
MNTNIRISPELLRIAELAAADGQRTVSEQIQYWAKIGKACIDNPDLPVNFVIDSLASLRHSEIGKFPFTRI